MSTHPIRVLVVGPAPASTASRGGMATVVALMAAHPDQRFAVTVTPTYLDGTPMQRLRVGVGGMSIAVWRILRGQTDVVHVHLSQGGSVVRKAFPLLAARIAGVASVVHGHSFDFGGWFDRLPAVGRRLVRVALPADRWLVLGDRHTAEYGARLQLPPERITVLHNAVQSSELAVEQQVDDPIQVVSLGRLGARKGSYDLIAAVAALPPEVRSRLRVTLAGDGEIEQVNDGIAAAGLTGTMRVVGWLDIPERDALLSAAQIFVLPSHDEGLPMALLEAMSRGVAPVTTTVGSIGEVVTDGVHGLLVAAGQPDQIAAALTCLVTDERLRIRLAAAARIRAGQFGLNLWYERLAELWLTLAAAPSSPR